MTKESESCGRKETIRCPCRTINLAKEGHTLEERKCKMLIYEKKYTPQQPGACAQPLELGFKEQHKDAKRVRMCTAADMRTTCPPPLCSCLPKVKGPTLLKKLITMGLKSFILGAVILTTYEMGIWGSAEQTECAYVGFKNQITGLDRQCDDLEPTPNSMGRNIYENRQRWNRIVSYCFQKTLRMLQEDESEKGKCDEEETCRPNKKKKKV